MIEREIRELASDYRVSVDLVRALAREFEDRDIVVEEILTFLDELAEFGYGSGGGYD